MRIRHFDISGINIRVHTRHDPEEYAKLWAAIWRLRKSVSHASNALMIGESKRDRDIIVGNFYRFLEVNIDDPWFDIDKHKKADEADVERVHIPPALKPNLTEIPYIFHLKTHRLYFVSHEQDVSVAPGMVQKLMERLTMYDSIKDKFGGVDLTVMTDRGKVAEMLKWPVIRRLTITLERPNPTEEEDDETVFERLNRRHLKSETHIYQKATGEKSIAVDDEMRAQAAHAADNGLVKVTGKNIKGEPDKAISKEFPLKIKATYEPSGPTAQTLKQALVHWVLDYIGRGRLE